MYTDINIFLLHTQYIDLRVPVHPVFRLQLLLPVPGNRVDYPVPPVTGTRYRPVTAPPGGPCIPGVYSTRYHSTGR